MQTLPQILITILLVVLGQTMAKIGMKSIGSYESTNSLLNFYIKVFLNPYVIAGTLFYGFGIFFWLYVLSKVELSFAYPFLSLTYVLVILAAWIILGEQIPPLRWVGISVICIGTLLVAKSY